MDEQLNREFHDPAARSKRKRNIRIGFCITLVILVLTSVLNWGIISSWGKVDIERVYVTGSNGAEWSALVYRPDTATKETPAPAIIMYHGNAGNARNHESWAVEFARRGFVVVAPDFKGSGDSLFTETSNVKTVTNENLYWFDYMKNLDFVDKDNLLTSGHSAGTIPAWDIGAYNNVKGILAAAGVSPMGHYKLENPDEYQQAWLNWHGNTVVCMGLTEMSNYSGCNDYEVFFQTNGLNILHQFPDYADATEILPDHMYGSFENGDGFIFCVEDYRIHEAAFVSKITIGHLVKYGQEIIGDAVPNYIEDTDQVWMYKDYVGLFGMFAFAAFVCALALLLIEEVPALSGIRRPLTRNIGMRGPGLVVASLIGLLAPWLVMKTDAFGIVGGKDGANLTKLGFHMRYANLGFGVVLGLTIVCLIGLVVFVISGRKKGGYSLTDFGMLPDRFDEDVSGGAKVRAALGVILPALLVTAIAIGVGFAYMQFMLNVAGTDFYAWFFGVKDIHIAKIPAYLPYLIVFIIVFVPLSIDMNVVRRLPSTGNETLDTIIAMVVNILIGSAMVALVVAVKWHLQSSNNWAADSNFLWGMGMDTQRIWGLPAGMAIASGVSTFIYRKTGSIWMAAILAGTIACMLGMLYGQYQFDFLLYPVLK